MKKNIYKLTWVLVTIVAIFLFGNSIIIADEFDEERNLIDSGRFEEALQELKEEEETYNYLRTKNINNLNLYVDYSEKLSIVLELIGDVYVEMNEIKLAINYYKKAKILHQLIVFEIDKNTESSDEYQEQKGFSGDEQIRIQKKIDALLNKTTDAEDVGTDIEEEDLSGGIEQLEPIEEEDTTDEEPADDIIDDDTEDEEPEDIIIDDEDTNEEGEVIGQLVDTIPLDLDEIGLVTSLSRLEFKNEEVTQPIEIPLSELLNISYEEFYNLYLYLEYYDANGFQIDGPQGLNNELDAGIYASLPDWKVYKSNEDVEDFNLILNTDFISVLDNTDEYRADYVTATYRVEMMDENSDIELERKFIFYDDINIEEDDTTDEEDIVDEDDDVDITIDDEDEDYIKAIVTLKSGGRLTVDMIKYINGIYRVRYFGSEFTIKENDITDIYFNVNIGDEVRVYLENGARIKGTITGKTTTSITLDAYDGELNIKFTLIKFMEYI